MQIHELNNFNGTPGATNFLAIDDGSDTSRISGEALLDPVNSRIDNLTANVLPDSVETILDWADVESASKTLTKNVSGFDYLDLYFKENTSGTDRIVFAQRYPRTAFPAQVTIPVIRWEGGTDPKYLFFQDLMIAISGTTLTMSQLRIYTWDGKAADGATIEPGILVDQIRVDGVKISSNTSAELTDLRTAHNGTVYASARAAREADYNALNGEITDVKTDFTQMTGNEKITFVEDFFINTSGSTVDITHPTYLDTYAYAVVDCKEGDAFTISGQGGGSPRLWCFIDASGNSLAVSDDAASANSLVLIAPKNADKLIINDKSGASSFKGVKIEYFIDDSQKLRVFKHSYGNAPTEPLIDLSIENAVSGKLYWLQINYSSASTQQFTMFRTNVSSPRSYDKYIDLKKQTTIDTGIQRYTETMADGEVISVVIDWDKVPVSSLYSYYPDLYEYNEAVFSGGLLTQFITQNLSTPNATDVSFIYDKVLIWYATESGHTGGSTARSGGYKSSNFIDASAITRIKGHIWGGGNTVANIAFYDEDQSYISGISNTSWYSYFVNIDASAFPANTAYIRICTMWADEYASNTYLSIIRGSSTLSDINNKIINLENNAETSKPLDIYWAACGDSITNANHGNIYDIEPDDPYMPIDGYADLNTYKRKNYAYYIAKENRIVWANYGYGGTTLTHCAPKAYASLNFYPFVDDRIKELKEGVDWDYITIFFGRNDYGFAPIYQRDLWLQETYGTDIGYPVSSSQIGASGFATQAQKDACDSVTGEVGGVTYNNNDDYFFARFIGTIDDNTKNTWYGAWNYALDYLMKKYPKAKIMIVNPYLPSRGDMVTEATKAIAEKWGVGLFDFNDVPYWFDHAVKNTTPFAPDSGNWTSESGAAFPNTVNGFNTARYSYDGTHPSNLGYVMMAKPFGDKLING